MSADSVISQALKSEPQFEFALSSCVSALRRVAQYELDPGIDRRMLELGERKEFLDESEHGLLMSLVEFSEKRSIEKLEAQAALKQLGECVPQVVDDH